MRLKGETGRTRVHYLRDCAPEFVGAVEHSHGLPGCADPERRLWIRRQRGILTFPVYLRIDRNTKGNSVSPPAKHPPLRPFPPSYRETCPSFRQTGSMEPLGRTFPGQFTNGRASRQKAAPLRRRLERALDSPFVHSILVRFDEWVPLAARCQCRYGRARCPRHPNCTCTVNSPE